MNQKTMTDILCLLSKRLSFTYIEMLNMPLDKILKYYKWVCDDIKEEMENKQKYDIALMKAFKCPLYVK